MHRRSRNQPHQAGLLVVVDLISDCYAFALLCKSCHVSHKCTVKCHERFPGLTLAHKQVTAADSEDSYGTAVLLETQGVVKGYKQPKDLLSVSDVPMRVVTPSASRALAGRLFAGHPSLRWLCACFVAVHELRVSKQAPFWSLKPQPFKLLDCHTHASGLAGQIASQGAVVGAHLSSGCQWPAHKDSFWQVSCQVLCDGRMAQSHSG